MMFVFWSLYIHFYSRETCTPLKIRMERSAFHFDLVRTGLPSTIEIKSEVVKF